METNFFKLDLKNKWAKDFVQDHEVSRKLYTEGYDLLKNAPDVSEDGKEPSFEERIAHFSKMAAHTAKLEESYHNLLISYSVFKAQAEKEEATGKEFYKLPPDISVVTKQLKTLMEGFEQYFEILKQTL